MIIKTDCKNQFVCVYVIAIFIVIVFALFWPATLRQMELSLPDQDMIILTWSMGHDDHRISLPDHDDQHMIDGSYNPWYVFSQGLRSLWVATYTLWHKQ